MEPIHYEIEIAPYRVLRGTIELPPQEMWPAPVVVFCHGFKGFKDWGPWPWFTHALAQRGFVVNRFNFSHSGVGPALDRHDEPEKFAENTYGLEMEDIRSLLREREGWGVPAEATRDRVALLGHSRGGLVALLSASEDEQVQAVVTLGAPGRSDRFPPEVTEKWRADGHLDIVNKRTGEVLRLSKSVLDDFEAHRDRYDLVAAIQRRDVPTLVIHGTEDESVAVEESEWIVGAISHARGKLVKLEATGHTFGAFHPFSPEQDHQLGQVLEIVAEWFGRNTA